MAGASKRKRIGRPGLLAVTWALIACGALAGCSQSVRPLDESIAGDGAPTGSGGGMSPGSGATGGSAQGAIDAGQAGGGQAGGGQGGRGDPPVEDEGWDGKPIEEPPCSSLGLRERVVDFQVSAAFFRSNPFGIVIDLRPTADTLPWLEEPLCACNDAESLGTYVLGDGETSVAVLAMSPHVVPEDPSQPSFYWSNDDLLETVSTLNARFPDRALAQVTVMPNDRIDVQLAMMERLASQSALWKVFTDWSPTGEGGFFLDDEDGIAMLGKTQEVLRTIVVVQKGKALPSGNIEYSSPRDIGPAAKLFPAVRLVVSNAAFEYGLEWRQTSAPDPERPDEDLGWGRGVGEWPEGPYEEDDAAVMEKYPLSRGVNSLIKSLRDAGIGPNGVPLPGSDGPPTNVYVTTGAAWANLISRPEEAMHFWGKLLLHVGEDRILWSSESPWYGPPRVLIEKFRAFEISEELQERYGYPALTPEVKAKILGINAIRLLSENGPELERCE